MLRKSQGTGWYIHEKVNVGVVKRKVCGRGFCKSIGVLPPKIGTQSRSKRVLTRLEKVNLVGE